MPDLFPAAKPGGAWTIKSDSENPTLRDAVQVNPMTGTIVGRDNFNRRMLFDRMVGFGIAVHEGQLFGLANKLLSLATALGLVTLCLSAVVMWWRRRPGGVLEAPVPLSKPRFTFGLVALVLALAIYLPFFGLSLLLVLLTERLVLRRLPIIRQWLGLAPRSQQELDPLHCIALL